MGTRHSQVANCPESYRVQVSGRGIWLSMNGRFLEGISPIHAVTYGVYRFLLDGVFDLMKETENSAVTI